MRLLKFTLLLLSFVSTVYGQNSIIIKDLDTGPGDTAKIIIRLENANKVSGLQFKIKVPTDLLVNEKEVRFVGRNTNHVIYPKALGNGEYLFLCFSGTNDDFTGQTGDLIEIPVEIPLAYSTGQTYPMIFTQAIVSSSAGQDIGSNPKNGLLRIGEGKNPDLKVSAITVLQNDITPNTLCSVKWEVQNIGLSAAIGGWREQISLVSQTTGKKYIIGYAAYDTYLTENESITRNAEIAIPSIIGFDGNVRIEVSLVTNTGVREPDNAKGNNTVLSLANTNLLRRLIFTIDRSEISENSQDQLRINLARSGDISTDEIFTISSDNNSQFNLPATIKINKNESSNFLYIKPVNNTTYLGDTTITLVVKGNTYNDENLSFNLLDDENVILNLDYPQSYSSAIGSKIVFTLTTNFSKNKDQIIFISTDKSKRLQLPAQVTLIAGAQNVTFEGTVLDTQGIEKTEIANIFAKAEGYTSANKEITLNSINIPNFTLSISPNKISEGDGIKSAYATIKRTNQIDKQTTVQISASKEEQLILPTEILFEKGQSEKIFNIGTVNNSQVEGERIITITSQIKFEGCLCTDNTDLTSIVNQDITILDNDGLSLIVKISPSTIKAGSMNNQLTISRNTDNPTILQNPVVVNLSSDFPSIVVLPNSVTIPANKKEVVLSFNTKIDTNITGDQSIRIQAEAQNYSSGFGWILVSDQNKPDALISEIITNGSLEAGKKIAVRTIIQNQGNSSFPAGYKIDYYLSKSNNISTIKPIVSSIINKVIAIGETYEYLEEIQLPNFSGDSYLVAVINADQSISELTYDNNQNQLLIKVLPSYNVTITLDKKVYKTSEVIKVSGIAKTAVGNTVPNAAIALKIKNEEFERNFDLKTDANGTFVFNYTPLENESGSYTVAAAFPGEEIVPQERFELLGFEILYKPQYIKWETLVGEPLGKEFVIKNKTNTKLTGIKIQLPPDADFTIDQTPMDIEAGATINFPFKIVSTIASKETKYYEFKIAIRSNEGAEYSELIYYYCKNQVAKLESNPIAINTTMVKGQARLYEFTLKNVGAVDAENVEVLLPELGWLRLNSQKVIERIKSNEEVKVVLEFQPTVKEQVNVPINGNFVIKQKAGDWLSIPFRLETVSESTGKLIVDATDEYTYNTVSAPHLKGAKVVVKHPFTGEVIAEGVTNELGLFEIPKINEGWYVVDVTADKHNPYQNNILVDPGKDTKVTAFLAYKAVTYSWDVKPTEILDEYEIKLDVKFETNVPVPVIIMDVDNPKLDLKVGESRMSYITVTNYGLIAAQKVSINAGEAEGYSIKPLITSLEILNAKSSIIIPVLIKNESSANRKSATALGAASGGGSCTAPITLRAVYICDTEKEMFAFTAYVKVNCGGGDGDGVVQSPIIYPLCFKCVGGGIDLSGGIEFGPASSTSTLSSFPNFCDPCLKQTVSATYSCVSAFLGAGKGATKAAGKLIGQIGTAFDIVTSTSFKDLVKTLIGTTYGVPDGAVYGILLDNPISDAFYCGWNIGKSINECIIDPLVWGNTAVSKRTSKSSAFLNDSQPTNGVWDLINEDFNKLTDAITAQNNMISEYIKNPDLEKYSILRLFIEQIAYQLDNQSAISTANVSIIKEKLKDKDISASSIDGFVSRWNTTVEAWNSNILSPNTEYPDIVDKVKIDEYKMMKREFEAYAFKRGFVSLLDMYTSDIEFIDEFVKEKSEDTSSVCASVTIEFPQKLTMTRQAFEGTLKINNGSSKSINDINLDLVVKDENGENKTHFFQINKEAFLSGTGNVNPDSNGSGLVTFIPTKEAAPEVKKSYSFGGTLSYFDPDVNERVSITLNPVTLEVNPSPDLVLHYFMQRDILGDDALTQDIVEPSLPAELSLMINNEGFGLAKNVNVESMQPKIIENEKGLSINFNMIGSNFNNEPRQLGLLNVNFGDIEPKQSAIGQWFFTSSLLGHFVKYDVKVSHKSSFGNANLSLIKGAYIHELVKSVKSYGINSDAISDFLVNDVSDAYDTPDRIYLSDGTSETVAKADAIQALNQVGSGTMTAKVKINPSTTGWNYGNILDPADNQYKLLKVVRDRDSFEIPKENFWQTQVTLKDGLNPKYENKLHVLDKISNIETYTLYFNPIDGNIPTIVSFIDAPEKNNTKPVEFVTVEFNKEIDVNTFTNANIELIHQGVKLPIDNILIGKINATTYSINITSLTKQSGYYELLVKALGVKDLLGNEGKDGKKIEWLQFINELGILKFETDQLKKQPINSVNIIFNKPIRSEEFTADKITVNNLPVSNLSIQKIDDYNYTISGISPFNKDNGNYTIAIDVKKITAVDGTKGLALQTYDWKVDNNIPKVVNMQTYSQGAINNQNITEIEIELNRKLVSKLEASSIQFTKNGQNIDIPVVIQKVDDLHYKIFGLGSYTADNGTYRLTIDQSTFRDENENFGEGIAETSWTVRLVALNAISNVKVSPDRGISGSDNITSGSDIQLTYKTLVDNITVEVYELLGTSEVLIDRQFREKIADYSISLKDKVGAKKFKVVAFDSNGNRSEPFILSAYLDFTDIITTIEPINNISNDCTDFDYVNVTFSDDLTANTFTIDAITLKSSGIVIPKDNIVLNKINERKYVIENIQNLNDGLIVLEIDKTKISKKLSGLNGFLIESKEIGSSAKYPITISGEENPNMKDTYTYTANNNMNKYDWIIINGEIISSTLNTVTVKWNKLNTQSLILRYQTPLNCTLTETKEVIVNDNSLGNDSPINIGKNLITPIPNNGRFTIHTSKILNDCTVSIFDVTGKLVFKENHCNFDKKMKDIDINLKSGMYILLINSQEEKLQFKFLVK